MIISPGRKFIFVHIPKTGGASLSLALEARAMKDDFLIGDTPKAKRRKGRLKGLNTNGRLWKHSTLADIDGLIDADELDDFEIFTLVRNPWDRMVSYYHWLQTQSFDNPSVDLAKSLAFDDFLAHPLVSASLKASPYGHYLTDANGQERRAHFLKLEELPEALIPLEMHAGFKLGTLPKANVSGRKRDYRTYYSEKSRTLVSIMCARDISRFLYTF